MKDKIGPNTVFPKEEGGDAHSGPGWKALTFDAALYERMIEDQDISEDAKHELLGVMWNIIVSFVDLGFEVKLADHNSALQSCGQSDTEAEAWGEAVLDCPLTQAINESFEAAMSVGDVDSKTKEEV